MKNKAVFSIFLLAGLVACRKEIVSTPSELAGTMTIKVVADETKATLVDGEEGVKRVAFNPGDNISVFANGTNNKFSTADGGQVAMFSGNAEDIEGEYYVISPYAKVNTISEEGKITINLPTEQKATLGSVDPKAMISVGKFKKGETLTLKNALALVKVTVPQGVKYKKIEFACSPKGTDTKVFNQSISGEIVVDASSAAMAVSSDADKRYTSITLVPAKGETTIGPGDYYIATRPGTYRISLGYVAEDDHFFVRHASQDNTLERSHIVNAGTLSAENYTDITAPAALTNGTAFNLAVKKMANSAVTAVNIDDNTITSIVVKPFSFGGLVGNFKDVKGSASAHPVTARLVGGELTLYTQGSSIVLDANCMALFRNMKALKSIDFAAFNSENVTNMTRTFAQSGFETLDLSAFKGDKVTTMNYAFENCTALTAVNMSNFSGKALTDMSLAFTGCSVLEKINLESVHTDKVTNFRGTFNACKGVSELKLGYYFTVSASNDCNNMFSDTGLNVSLAGGKCDLYCTNEFYNAVYTGTPGRDITKFNPARFNLHAISAGVTLLTDNTVSLIKGCKGYAAISVVPADLEGLNVKVGTSSYFTSAVEPGSVPGEYNITFEDSSVALEYNESIKITANYTEKGEAKKFDIPLTVKNSEVNTLDTGLPIVLVETPGRVAILDKENWIEGASLLILNPDLSVSYEGGISVKGRGNNTWLHPKKPYAIKLDSKSAILGMKSHKRWCLLANYVDRTLMRNELAFEIGHRTSLAYTPSGKFVDCFVNGVFAGNYYLCEQIKVDKNRVNIAPLTAGEGDGGYIFEFDDYFDEVNKFRTEVRNLPAQFKDPDEVDAVQFAFARDYINSMEHALYDNDKFAAREFENYMDLQSFCDYYIIMELAQNMDAAVPKSHYMHKDKGGKIVAGPIWDFDYATFIKNPLMYYGNPPREGYNFMFQAESHGTYYHRLFQDREFKKLLKERWMAMREDLATIPDFIDQTAASIKKSEEINHRMWPIDNRDLAHDEKMSFEQAVQTLKDAYTGKFEFLDSQISKWNF